MSEKLSKEAMIEGISSMSVLELSELVKSLEDKFGVSAAAPMAFAAAPGAAAGAAPAAAEEKTDFTVVLSVVGANKIPVIKVIREITGLGLKEAKDLVDVAPKPVKENVPKDQAEEMKKKLADVGATVELK
jgi:large subunit ribosomal protein L7/L12